MRLGDPRPRSEETMRLRTPLRSVGSAWILRRAWRPRRFVAVGDTRRSASGQPRDPQETVQVDPGTGRSLRGGRRPVWASRKHHGGVEPSPPPDVTDDLIRIEQTERRLFDAILVWSEKRSRWRMGLTGAGKHSRWADPPRRVHGRAPRGAVPAHGLAGTGVAGGRVGDVRRTAVAIATGR